MPDQNEITALLDAWGEGDAEALEELLPLVLDDLRRIARGYLARERPGHTLEPTALIHEVYLRLMGRRRVHWENRRQFFTGMAEIMRRVLVDHARRKKAAKKGGGKGHAPFDEALDSHTLWGKAIRGINVDLVALDEALTRLAAIDSRQARTVELRYFGGLTIEETARTLECSPMTVKREWHTARLWLLRALSAPEK
jgi:RNA polymerase sigma factor (TIGR02999 family)